MRSDNAWLQTATGRQFWPLDARPTDVVLEDVAHSLAIVNRFTGHTSRPYSVASHSLMVADILALAREPVAVIRAGLLHDASEAYLCDLARPVKDRMPDYRAFEDRLQAVIEERFSVRITASQRAAVKKADNTALMVEREQLMQVPPAPWQPVETYDLGFQLYCSDECWRLTKARFLRRCSQLGIS